MKALHPLLGADNAEVKTEVIVALGHLADRASVRDLLKARHDESALVRRNVAFALGMIGGSEAIWGLGDLLEDEDADVVEWALVGLQDEDDLPGEIGAKVERLSSAENEGVAEAAKRVLRKL